MNDSLKRYCAILIALKQWYPTEPTGHLARHLCTMAALICGIVGSQKCHLPTVAGHLPSGSSPKGGNRESRVKRFARFLQNPKVTPETFFIPYARALIASLPDGPLVLIMDGSQVGRGCMTLMLSVLYRQKDQNGKTHQRALPLCWLTVQAPKGHFTEDRHKELVAQARQILEQGLPARREVIFLGDGEFDGPELLAAVREAGWHFVCRTAKSSLLCEMDWPQETFSLSELCLQPGDAVELSDHLFTGQRFGPVLLGAVWEVGQKEPLFLVTSLDFFEEARFWYRRRFGIETFFSDQKSRGFYLCHSHLSDPARLSRLLLATCLAYYWLVCLGAEVVRHGWVGVVHRRHRCDLSLFQLGRVWAEHCLNEGWRVPVIFQMRPLK